MTKSERQLLDAMNDFRESYNAILLAVASYESNTNSTVNDVPGFVEGYPFHKSLDELAINEWVDEVANDLRGVKFTVLDYTYLNTGGNCMVGIFQVWLPDENRTVWALTNEEGCTLATVDYISNELEIHEYDEVMIDSIDWGRATGHEKYFELYRHCLNEYTKSDCKYFGYTCEFPYHLLSDELQKQISEHYHQWTAAEYVDTFMTDGVKIIVHPDYAAALEEDKLTEDEQLKALKEFDKWHKTTAGDEEYYSETYKLEFAGHKIELPFMADVWDAIDTLLKTTIENW